MKILVTGATGFVGQNLMDFLATLPESLEIYVLARDLDKAARFADLPKRVHLLMGDVTQPETLVDFPRDLDYVVHAASLVRLKNGSEFFAVNAEGTQNLLQALKGQKNLQRFVLISSISAVDRPLEARPPYAPLTEISPCSPRTDYGKSKLQAETRVIASGFPYTILRPGYIYGPHPRAMSSVDRVVYDVQNGNPYTRFPFTGHVSEIYAPDLAEIIWQVARSPLCENETYFVANPHPVAVKDWFRRLHELLEKPYQPYPIPRFLLPWLKNSMIREGLDPLLGEILFQDYFVCSPAKLYQHITYRPYYGFGAGLTKTIQWYRENHLLNV